MVGLSTHACLRHNFYDAESEVQIELGIMVWQDFMFACGQYPAHDDFLALVKTEAEQAIVRLRHHPSLVIYGKPRTSFFFICAE